MDTHTTRSDQRVPLGVPFGVPVGASSRGLVQVADHADGAGTAAGLGAGMATDYAARATTVGGAGNRAGNSARWIDCACNEGISNRLIPNTHAYYVTLQQYLFLPTYNYNGYCILTKLCYSLELYYDVGGISNVKTGNVEPNIRVRLHAANTGNNGRNEMEQRERVTFTISTRERTWIEMQAEMQGISVSLFVRTIVQAHIASKTDKSLQDYQAMFDATEDTL